jgi:hypothetical protein
MHLKKKSASPTCASQASRPRRRDQEGAIVMVQHKAVVGPNEVKCQGCCRHVATTCDYEGLHLGDERAP